MTAANNNNNIPNDTKQVAIFMLAVLEAVLNEQARAKLISHDAARYVLVAVRDQAIRQGWIPASESTG